MGNNKKSKRMSLKEIEKMIQEQVEDQQPSEVESLALDDQKFSKFSPELKAKLESYPNLVELSLINCGLTSLENFPNLPNLQAIDLADNHLSPQELNVVAKFTNLQRLILSKNKIKDFDDLKPLAALKLIEVDFTECEIAKKPNYPDKLFQMFSTLEVKFGNEDM
eukprot:TRINITY_DN1409_c0_g1_i3.p1 TRINITY_DN1409_c0_g1~~TRINITY_DN1409_c0_g1_i3.p1  ORF type:complete len:165 (-),score=48.92 TRINITY_DN1409_c0_g1_i3:298-792(-)